MTVPAAQQPPVRHRLGPRARLAVALEHAASAASRRLGRGSGEMIGGKVALRADPGLMPALAAGRVLGCVSATNGKTTTTRLLASALATAGPVTSNSGGANMGPGVLHALARRPWSAAGALEVDEIWLPQVARAVQPVVVALLNISRDQLDRSNETRRIAGLWRSLGAELPGCTAVANCDDPLVVFAAHGFAQQRWVSAGQNWTADAMVCPVCASLLVRRSAADLSGAPTDPAATSGGVTPLATVAPHWLCSSCDFARPEPSVEVQRLDTVLWDGEPRTVRLALPGRVNLANAAMAAAAAQVMGVDPAAAFGAMQDIRDVAGRYQEVPVETGRRARLLLAKNPAGWVEMLELLESAPPRPIVIAFNSRTADGRDPSWLWDVPFERLAGRRVLVCGERREDVGVRLAYAEVTHTLHDDVEQAVAAAGVPVVDVVANYTAFRDVLTRLGRTEDAA